MSMLVSFLQPANMSSVLHRPSPVKLLRSSVVSDSHSWNMEVMPFTFWVLKFLRFTEVIALQPSKR